MATWRINNRAGFILLVATDVMNLDTQQVAESMREER